MATINTDIDMPELDREGGKAVLSLSTYKYANGGIISTANVHIVKNGMITCILGRDFSKRVQLDRVARATRKALEDHHKVAFSPESIATLKDEAITHYAGMKLS